MRAKLLQLCLTLCNPVNPGSSVYGVLQARILEWVAMPTALYSSHLKQEKRRLGRAKQLVLGQMAAAHAGKPHPVGNLVRGLGAHCRGTTLPRRPGIEPVPPAVEAWCLNH